MSFLLALEINASDMPQNILSMSNSKVLIIDTFDNWVVEEIT